ncbi:MAG: hypothetical protein JSU83_01860 [Deltaproteobacteria bacterium]|nr:MAG: hypothetical protein JSU83_01860 [Deltaproteobacteria bacterium]
MLIRDGTCDLSNEEITGGGGLPLLLPSAYKTIISLTFKSIRVGFQLLIIAMKQQIIKMRPWVLHLFIGDARTTICNWLFAKKSGGHN